MQGDLLSLCQLPHDSVFGALTIADLVVVGGPRVLIRARYFGHGWRHLTLGLQHCLCVTLEDLLPFALAKLITVLRGAGAAGRYRQRLAVEPLLHRPPWLLVSTSDDAFGPAKSAMLRAVVA